MQQCLPFTVLKLSNVEMTLICFFGVATVLTVYGIETFEKWMAQEQVLILVATVLTVYGIETGGYIY